jgi:hypothetical protein
MENFQVEEYGPIPPGGSVERDSILVIKGVEHYAGREIP